MIRGTFHLTCDSARTSAKTASRAATVRERSQLRSHPRCQSLFHPAPPEAALTPDPWPRARVSSFRLRANLRECLALRSILVKVVGVQPRFEGEPPAMPLGVQHGIPRRISIPPLDDHVLPKEAFKGEPIAESSAPRCLIQ